VAAARRRAAARAGATRGPAASCEPQDHLALGAPELVAVVEGQGVAHHHHLGVRHGRVDVVDGGGGSDLATLDRALDRVTLVERRRYRT